jgi:hypothetical protein
MLYCSHAYPRAVKNHFVQLTSKSPISEEKATKGSEKHIEEELKRLWKRLRNARGRRSRITGTAFLIMSGFFLVLAYITRYLLFEVTSILALFLGVIYVFTSMESYVRTRVATGAVISAIAPLAILVDNLEVEGRAIYIPALSGEDTGRTFLPLHDELARETSVLGRGIFLASIGSALLQLYEEELGDIGDLDWDYFVEWFPRIFVDELNMAEKMEIFRDDDEVTVRIAESAFRQLYQNKNVGRFFEINGDPVVVSIGEAIAKNTNRSVFYVKHEFVPLRAETNVSYKLGVSLEDFKQT